MKNKKNSIILLFKLLGFLPKKFKYRSILSLFIMILSSFAEIISLSLIVPFLLILTSPKEIWDYQIIRNLSILFDINETSILIFWISILFIIASLASALIRILNLYYISKLAASMGNYFAFECFRKILYQDYIFHLNMNTSEIISSITLNVSRTVLIINQLFLLVTSILIGTGIISSLLFINASVTIYALFIFSIAYLLIALSTKKKLSKNSKLITESSSLQIKSLQEGLGSIRDILINSSYRYFLKLFNKADANLRFSLAENQVIASSPRYAIESLGIILIVCLSLQLRGTSESLNLIPLLGTLAFASQKLIPTIQQIYASLSNVRAYSVSLAKVIDLVSKPIKENQFSSPSDSSLFKKNIQFKNVSFRYNKRKPFVLEDINLQINKGQKIGIVGETGSGKTTLIDILMGLLAPNSGKVLIDDKETQSEIPISYLRSLISHVPQNIFISDGTFAENIAFGIEKSKIDYERVKNVSQKSCLMDFIDSSEEGFETKVGERGIRISGGQKQRIGIARALYRDCKILLLDEATSALDSKTEKELIKNIHLMSNDLTIIMVAHRLTTLKLCDTIFEIKDGKVYEKKL